MKSSNNKEEGLIYKTPLIQKIRAAIEKNKYIYLAMGIAIFATILAINY